MGNVVGKNVRGVDVDSTRGVSACSAVTCDLGHGVQFCSILRHVV